ncbi:MAG TPA: hypothetical protein VFQ74_07110 [Pseudolysinimonas sp.]|nr:hypothetical protein [Pseudolysinimonas sp.]
MWHYEYAIDQMFFRFPADGFEDCLTALIVARASNPLMRDPKIFRGGSHTVGSGSKVFDQHEQIGYARPSVAPVVAESAVVA